VKKKNNVMRKTGSRAKNITGIKKGAKRRNNISRDCHVRRKRLTM
jgi:hypothetical protein